MGECTYVFDLYDFLTYYYNSGQLPVNENEKQQQLKTIKKEILAMCQNYKYCRSLHLAN